MIEVSHYSDPACPWAYSAGPAIAVLRWRYGAQLGWRHVMIGLAETPERYLRNGYTPERSALSNARFRKSYGMPFTTEPRAGVSGTARRCRAVVATRLHAPELEWAAFRALQFATFTTALTVEEDESLRWALGHVAGLDVDEVVGSLDDPVVSAAYEADKAEARTAEGGATEFQGKAAATDGPVRYTAPSLVFAAPGGRRLEAGGFQPIEAYDVCVANLDPTLLRRQPPEDVAELLTALPEGLTTAEVAACLADGNDRPDRDSAEATLIAAVARGAARREPLGSDALWLPL